MERLNSLETSPHNHFDVWCLQISDKDLKNHPQCCIMRTYIPITAVIMMQNVEDEFHYSEEECALALFRAKWANGFCCPRCGHGRSYRIQTRRLPLFECANCHTQTSLTVNTVMQGSKLPLTSWFRALQLHASPTGVNALQLSRIISVTYKSAWLLCHKIRHAMSSAEAGQLLTGMVKLTGVIHCRQILTQYLSSWHDREQSLLVGVSESQPGQFDRIKLKVQNKHALIRKRDQPDPASFVKQHVAAEARATVVVTSVQQRNLDIRVNRVALAARRWLAALFGGIGPKHLQVYLDQFCYDWNQKGAEKFAELLHHCAQTKTILYRELVSRTRPINADQAVQTGA